MRSSKITISVIGSHDSSFQIDEIAYQVGKMIASLGAVMVCGGLDGVMAAAARGAKEAGGLTIGLLPGTDKGDANPYIDVALPTSIGFARNAMVACSADIIIALPGSHGTNSEICYGLVYNRPVIDLGGWKIKGMIPAANLEETAALLKEYISRVKKGL